MSRDVAIHSWPGSYYINGEKRWENGTLSLTRTTVRFVSNQSKESLATFRLSRIVAIKMESSSFIFSTLTVLEEGDVKHWFGSLKPNRVVVHNVLEHFWRERLLSPSSEARGAESQPSKGRALINLVAGAQRRLEDTGTVLSHQGEQFDNMMQGLEKIDSDLGVADKLLLQLESPSWWPFGKLPWKTQQEAKAEDAARAAASAAAASAGSGSGRNKATPVSSPCGREGTNWNEGLLQDCQESELPLEVPAGELSQLQVHVLQPSVSQAEAQELKQMLMQLKNLALEAETELERQDDVLDELTSSTDRATMHIEKHTCRMKRLL
ncbi:synaptosomal-associated protein 47 isoform X3 [Scophthalmus maximus]|uniref:synaptosomal-associated protein 47 isoform X3 n=1 Tax=Scophthalmus maximus TaxID=52904 RepID=UPI0015E116CC|nr:synaptosomal-associated protein 47 isoform X3 [Scophthalmus maximus]